MKSPAQPPLLNIFADDGHIRPLAELKAEIAAHALAAAEGKVGKAALGLRIRRGTLCRMLLSQQHKASAARDAIK